ncbi:hypothetical protein [Ramlibacter sp. 2FC]|uniref:hypothetical protein n=1 Tax=Ramlibacter sp. 2FC TaxID=2502188 RepID=UPI0010F6DF28|nr:hypothetical protein [Ramlibacter sp. 2FC]
MLAAAAAGAAALVAGCVSRPEAPAPAAPAAPAEPTPAPAAAAPPGRQSAAASAREYRRDAAGHLYGLNAQRIYKGRLPPLLYAVGVLQVDLDPQGRVQATRWMRAPRHAPEVMAEIERTVRQASPFPAPARLGRVTYTDTWLWHKSGRFQLDTLTEGQD